MAEAALRLVADLGGTNARFALAGPGAPPDPPVVIPVAAHPRFLDALDAFLGGRRVGSAAIAAAGPVEGGRVQLTNAAWFIDRAEISAALGGVPVAVLNDLEAVALALPHLGEADCETLFPGDARPRPLLAFNVGTGLGAAVAVPSAEGWQALATEPGHMAFAPAAPDEAGLGDTCEDILSGPGLARLRERLGAGALPVFSRILGRIVGDVVLATGSWGGVFLCGGVMEDWDNTVDAAAFRAAFLDKGPMSERMARVPVRRITRPSPALLGLAHAPLARPASPAR